MSRRSLRSAFTQQRGRAPVFAALGDETRLSLLTKLGDRQPHSISQLTHGSRLTRQAITKHLRVLQRAGIVRGSRAGRASRFILDPRPIDDLQHYLDSFPPNGTKPSPA
jgi:DNA-binding transcriptional ArsR family regulator